MASSSIQGASPEAVHHHSNGDGGSDLVDCVTILFASETGNAQDVAERVGREFRRRSRRAKVVSMTEFDIVRPHYQMLSGRRDR